MDNIYKNERYEEAFEEYIKCIEEDNAIAHLNIGYLYSHGLGCITDFEQAQHHYKEAIKLGKKKEGFDNYMALNLVRPIKMENTIAALQYGYEIEDRNTICYLSYLQTGIMYANFENNCEENARIFMQKIKSNQDLDLEKRLVIESVEINEIDRRYILSDTIFKKYSKCTEIWGKRRGTNYIKTYKGE